MAMVDRELAAANLFDFAVINDDLARAVSEVLGVISAVREGRGEEISAEFGLSSVMARWSAKPSA